MPRHSLTVCLLAFLSLQAAIKKDWVLLDMELMLAGRANELQWMPDGLHPNDFALKEYGNVVLNVLYQAKKWKVPHKYGQLV